MSPRIHAMSIYSLEKHTEHKYVAFYYLNKKSKPVKLWNLHKKVWLKSTPVDPPIFNCMQAVTGLTHCLTVTVPVSVKQNLKMWSNCSCFWMYYMLPCSRLLNSTWLLLHFILWCLNTHNTALGCPVHNGWPRTTLLTIQNATKCIVFMQTDRLRYATKWWLFSRCNSD